MSKPWKGAVIFFGRGVPNLQKVGINKTATPLFRQQKFYDPPYHRYTLPPKQAKIVLKSVFLINTLSVVILWLPTLWSSTILWPPVYLGPTPSEENASPLNAEGLYLQDGGHGKKADGLNTYMY